MNLEKAILLRQQIALFVFILPGYSFLAPNKCHVEIRVADGNNNPIPGVVVQLLGTDIGEVTNENGKVEFILICGKTHKIQARSVGYEKARCTIVLANKQAMDLTIRMKESTVELNEVIVESDADKELF